MNKEAFCSVRTSRFTASTKRLLPYITFLLAIIALRWTGATAAAQEGEKKTVTATQQYQDILKEFSAATSMFWQETNDAGRQRVMARVEKLPPQLLEWIQNNPKAPVALDALVHVVSQEYWLNNHTSHSGWGQESPQAKAINLMLRDFIDSDKLGEACNRIHYCLRQECETFLRAVFEKSPHREVKGLACLRLAQFLGNRLEKVELLKDQPEAAKRFETLYGKDYLGALQRQDRLKVMEEAEALYDRALTNYGDVKTPYDGTVAETAKTDLFEIRHLAIGREALEIEEVDQDGQQFKLSDYRGKVVLLYFWSEF
jgi:type II secretory pathway pseudopilin PulG